MSLRSTMFLVVPVVGSLALSGCFGGGAASVRDPEGTVSKEQARFDDTRGGIEGLVVDPEHVGIPGAQVGIPALDPFATTTDEMGAFSLSLVAPGTHDILATRLGYAPGWLKVEVQAGAVARGVRVVLEPLPSQEPYTVSMSQNGIFGCGVTGRATDQGLGVAACGVLSAVDEEAGTDTSNLDQFLLTWRLEEPIREWRAAVFEMSWQANQVAGQGLAMVWEIDGCVNAEDNEGRLADESGKSPLRAFDDASRLREVLDPEDGQCVNVFDQEPYRKECGEQACRIISRVFATPGTLGEAAPADAGVTLQQTYTQYLTAFFHQPPPAVESYTALES